MIKYPPCFSCSMCDSNFCCPAFPDGITDDVLKRKMDEGRNKECANGIFYTSKYREEKKDVE